MKVALITGITGQDGSYLTELLLDKGYIVWGIIRRASTFNIERIEHLRKNQNLILKYGDLSDQTNLVSILSEIRNTYVNMERLEIYNLGAMSHVKVSFELPEYTGDIDGLGVLRLLEAIRMLKMESVTRFYQASSSELYGKVVEVPQTETTPFYPRSPYAVAKLYGYWITKNYREAYDIYACNGILFNHESPRRGVTFVTRKITRGIKEIFDGKRECLTLGNLEAKRDWGHAKDYIDGMWLILQQDKPDDYVLSTGEYHSVREFVEIAFGLKGIKIQWSGSGLDEVGCDEHGQVLVRVSDKYYRPTEVDELLGDSSKARTRLGWEPKYSFTDLVSEMMKMEFDET